MIEDFTHVLPEDKPIHRKQKRHFMAQVFDLAEANRRARYFQEVREKAERVEKQAKMNMEQRYRL
jgi:hypothetical protein